MKDLKSFVLVAIFLPLCGFSGHLTVDPESDADKEKPVLHSIPPPKSDDEVQAEQEAAAEAADTKVAKSQAELLAEAAEKNDHAGLRIEYNFNTELARYKFLSDAQVLIDKKLETLRLDKSADDTRQQSQFLTKQSALVKWKMNQIEQYYGRKLLALPPVPPQPGVSPEVIQLANQARAKNEEMAMTKRMKEIMKVNIDNARTSPKTLDAYLHATPREQAQMRDAMPVNSVSYESLRITPEGEMYMTGMLRGFDGRVAKINGEETWVNGGRGFTNDWVQVPLVSEKEKQENKPLEVDYGNPHWSELASNSPIQPGPATNKTPDTAGEKFNGQYAAGGKALVQPLSVVPEPKAADPGAAETVATTDAPKHKATSPKAADHPTELAAADHGSAPTPSATAPANPSLISPDVSPPTAADKPVAVSAPTPRSRDPHAPFETLNKNLTEPGAQYVRNGDRKHDAGLNAVIVQVQSADNAKKTPYKAVPFAYDKRLGREGEHAESALTQIFSDKDLSAQVLATLPSSDQSGLTSKSKKMLAYRTALHDRLEAFQVRYSTTPQAPYFAPGNILVYTLTKGEKFDYAKIKKFLADQFKPAVDDGSNDK